MKTRCALVWSLAALAAAAAVAAVQVTTDKENVVASRLEGQWMVRRELTLDLTGRPDAIGESAANRIAFVSRWATPSRSM